MKDSEFYLDPAHERASNPEFNGDLYDETRRFFPAYVWYRPSKDIKGEHVGWCSNCGAFIDEGNLRGISRSNAVLHNQDTECPFCRRDVTLKCEGRMKNYNSLCTDANIAYFYSPEPDLVYIRVFDMLADYSDTKEPFPRFRKIWKSETARYRLRPGEWISEKHDWYGNLHGTKEPYDSNLTRAQRVAGLCGAERVLPKTFLRYHQLAELQENSEAISVGTGVPYCYETVAEYRPLRYLCYFAMYPQLEMVAKLGLHWAVNELVNKRRKNARLLNWNAKTPHEFLRLTKQQTREYLDGYASSKTTLSVLQSGKGKLGVREADEVARKVPDDRIGEFVHIVTQYRQSAAKVFAYIQKKKITVSDYLDYIKGAEGLGYDLTVHNVIFPKNFHEAHDEAIRGIAIGEYRSLSKTKQRALKKRSERYEYTIHGCSFIFPVSVTEIVEEGKCLGHCVGGYAARHMEGKTTIVFMRRADAPSRSWYTIEINGTTVRQAYGKGNKIRPQNDKEARRAYHLWLCHLQHKKKKLRGTFENLRHVRMAV